RRIECCGIDGSRLRVGFALNLERVLCRGGTDRCHIAFLLTTDVRGLAASLRTEPSGDLMPLARHALNDLLRNRWIVFAALETFIEQFDSEIGNLLPRAFCNLFLNFTAPEFNIGNRARQHGPAFLQLLVAQRLSSFGYANNLDEIVRGDGGARFAAQNIIQA